MDDTVRSNVMRAVDGLRDDIVGLASDMIQIPSINPDYGGVDREAVLGGESRVNELLKPIMEGMGLETDMWEAEERRANLVGVCKGSGGGRSLILNGHVDVVPPGPDEQWTVAEPWSGTVIDGRLYGRGATDMKAGDAAAIMALKAVLDAGYQPKGDVILEMVIGEEMMSEAGTRATIERGYLADAGIVVEPSSPPYRLGIMTASPGVLILNVIVEGKPAHTCMRDELIRAGGRGSEVAVSAVDKAMIVYRALLDLEEEWGQTKSHPAFARPGHFTLCPTTFKGGLEGIAYIPKDCSIEYVIWHAPQDTPEAVKAEVEAQIARYAQTDPWLREHPPKAEWWDWWWPPYDVPADAPICNAVATAWESALGEPAKFYGFAAVDDAAFLNQAGIPTLSMGPGDIKLAHAPNEYIDIADVIDAAKVYALTIVEWCGI
jgi:acetylornithine deacetylase/succinyl-diaminopimelate desuccinylase family protein